MEIAPRRPKGITTTMLKFSISLLSMSLGGVVYILWRTEALLMFQWLEAIGIGERVRLLREVAAPGREVFSDWIYFSLPQALWLFSGLVAFSAIWGPNAEGRAKANVWSGLFLFGAFSIELGQFLGCVPGTFDPVDLAFLAVALLCACPVTYL